MNFHIHRTRTERREKLFHEGDIVAGEVMGAFAAIEATAFALGKAFNINPVRAGAILGADACWLGKQLMEDGGKRNRPLERHIGEVLFSSGALAFGGNAAPSMFTAG